MSALLPFDDAFARLLSHADMLPGTETIDTMNADGRVLARALVSSLDVPLGQCPDGWLRRASRRPAANPDTVFPVSQRIPAGHQGQPLQPGTVARIFTGAALPPGADAVVMQEEVEAGLPLPGGEGTGVRFRVQPTSGAWVRRRAEDIAAGSTVLAEGARLTPAAVGLAASIGAATLEVRRCPRVACFFTGDELVMPGQPLPAGGIYNSNRFVLNALLRRLGCEVLDLGIVPDSREATRQALREAAKGADLIISAGGVSVGEEDHVRPAVEAEGQIDLWRVAIKPGRPLAYGRVGRHGPEGARAAVPGSFAHFIGLPGNPVSAFVTFLLFVRPFLLRLQGIQAVEPQAVTLISGFDWTNPDRRREFLRAVHLPDGRLGLFRQQGSAVLTSAVVGHGLIDNPPGQVIRQGDAVRFLSFAELLN
ncbi:molybdopterin molybdotransferase MoeA [Lautropia mirabilis]